jgi:hypothetical protein
LLGGAPKHFVMTTSPETPLFLLGAPRSGTSLLYKALCLHPDAAYISNWVRRFPSVPALAALNRVGRRLPQQRMRSWFSHDSNAYVHMGPRSVVQRAFPSPAEGEPVFRRCGIPGQPPIQASEGQLRELRNAFGAVRRFGGGEVFVNKRIANNLRIALLVKAFPDARFVNLVRDGRAVAASLVRVDWWEDDPVWWYGATPREWVRDGGDPWDVAARHWVEELRVVEQGLSGVEPDRLLEVRYEDVVDDAVPALREIAEFGGLTPSPAWEGLLAAISIVRDEQWRVQLTAEQIQRVEAIQADELARHGYSLTR